MNRQLQYLCDLGEIWYFCQFFAILATFWLFWVAYGQGLVEVKDVSTQILNPCLSDSQN